jgi:hypothetical protein
MTIAHSVLRHNKTQVSQDPILGPGKHLGK